MIVAIVFLIIVSFFFSGSETALTATNKIKLQTQAKNGNRKAEKLLNILSKPSEFITSILIGNNIANILLPTLVTTLAIQYDFDVATATAILTVTIIIFSEVIPKSVAASFPDRIALLVYPIIRIVIFILKPITKVLNWMTERITNALSNGQPKNAFLSKEEFRAMVDIADSEGAFHKEESHRIKGVLDFHNLNVKDVLKTPRIEVVALPITASYEEIREIVINNPFSRYPVYEKDIDNIVGVFHSKFLIRWSRNPEETLKQYCDMEPLVVYESHSVEWVFRQMTKHKKHMAIVLDEYGGTEGILSHEDIIETMIGLEIGDETDLENDSLVEKLSETEIICEGKITLHQLNSIFNTEIPEEEDVLAGYLLKEFNKFPDQNDVIERNNLTFRIVEIKGQTIKKVQIIK